MSFLFKQAVKSAKDEAVEVTTKFEVGKVYYDPYDRNWLAKVVSRTDSSVKVYTKTRKDRNWRPSEIVTLRINKRKSEESDAEIASGEGWTFYADSPL